MRKRCAGSTPAARTTRPDGSDRRGSRIQKQTSAVASWPKPPMKALPKIEANVGATMATVSTAASAAAGRSTTRTAA
ncbi:hypothetical protein [Bradyrhizobium sp. Cp5.3]|uniref:hypothetical protein n=1 Tax=Bradyrhizobium sp. Cp5.3 TaxID=443598 RepID=UPI0018DE740D|nr:hypothetical protein [Bradyrhizobium sp. Cp5.3]